MTLDSVTGRSRVSLLDAVREQPWSWLAAIAEHLGLALEIVSDAGISGPEITTGDRSATLRGWLSSYGGPDMQPALSEAIESRQPQRLPCDVLDVLCAAVIPLAATPGAILLARDKNPRAAGKPIADLAAIASWLADAITSQLDGRPEESESFDRGPALHRLLSEAVDRGDEQDVFASFAEALLAWDGIEVKAFAQIIPGEFSLRVATPGASRTEPGVLRGDGLLSAVRASGGASEGLLRLTPREASAVGFPHGRGVVVACIGTAVAPRWLVAFSSTLDPLDVSRLELYVGLVRDALDRVTAAVRARLAWAILPHLLASPSGFERSGEAGLKELAQRVDAPASALVVIAANGVRLLSLGDRATASSGRNALEGGSRVVSVLPVLNGCTMILSVGRPGGPEFSPGTQVIVDGAAAIFAAWLPGEFNAIPRTHERRNESRRFDDVMDRAAAQSVAEGIDVSVIVIEIPGTVSRPGMLHDCVARMRAELRASDLAGTLSDKEIGVLLSGVTAKDVPAMRARLLEHVRADEAGSAPLGTAVGAASWLAGSPAGESLVRTARQAAARPSEPPATR